MPNKPSVMISKPPIAVAVLYDGSGTAEGILDINRTDLFAELTEYISHGYGGALKFNFVTDKTRLSSGVELFINPIYLDATRPIKNDFNSSLMYSDAMNAYKSKIKRFNNFTKPRYDSTFIIKVNQFNEDFEDYKKILSGETLKHSSQIELSIAKTMPFFKAVDDTNTKKSLVIISDGWSNTPKGFKLDIDSFNSLGIRTFVIGLSDENASGDWMNINYQEATNYSRIIDKIINNKF